MRIIYEPGDIVEVEDNSDAGDMACKLVKLVRLVRINEWEVVTENDWKTTSGVTGTVHERYFQR